MRTIIIALTLATIISGHVKSQNKPDSLKLEIQRFFFDLPTNVSLDSLGHLLADNKNFKQVKSKTYDPKTTITGQITKDKNLNSNADYNQFIVSVWGDRQVTADTLRFGWYISYGLNELELATKGRDDLKAKFRLLFPDMVEKTKQGYHGEINEHVFFQTGKIDFEIRLTKYERPGNHRVSIIYTEIRE